MKTDGGSMNTLFFKYAIEVERTRSITQAAENLFMAQPNLSKAIKEMEDLLGFAVFERTSKGVIPTKKGNAFLEHAHNIVMQLDKIENIAQNDKNNIQRLSISIPRVSYISKGITKLVGTLDQSKGINLNIQETNSMQTINNLVKGTFNLGIIRYQELYEQYFHNFLSERNLCFEVIWEFSYHVLFSKKHKLASKQNLVREDLSESIEIIHGDNMIPYISNGKWDTEDQEITKKRIYVYERGNQFELLSSIPSTYMWVSTIPDDMLQRFDLQQRKCNYPGNRYKDLLIYPKGYRFMELERRFIDKLYEAKNEVTFTEIE